MSNIGILLRSLWKLRALRSHDQWTRMQLLTYQKNSLKQLRQFTYQRSPFYQKLHQGLEHAPLAALPVVTKAMLMEHFNIIVTDKRVLLNDVRTHIAGGNNGKFLNTYEAFATSGSTGNPGIFVFAPHEWIVAVSSFARVREWAGMKIDLRKRSKMAVVTSTNDRNLSARIGRVADTPFIPSLRIDAHEPIAAMVDKLNAFQPETVVAYVSLALLLADEQRSGRLQIAPKKIFTSSEVLTPHARKVIEMAFGQHLFNTYATTETAALAAEDTHHHGMHVYEDLLVVENVDHDNQPVPDGRFGEKLLVTNLFNRTLPLIRYELSDSVRFSGTQPDCPLPYRTIDSVQGRSEDILLFHGIPIHPNVFSDIFEVLPVKQWQVHQEKNGVTILLVEPKIDQESIKQKIAASLKQSGISTHIAIATVSEIPKAKSGKTALIKAYKP